MTQPEVWLTATGRPSGAATGATPATPICPSRPGEAEATRRPALGGVRFDLVLASPGPGRRTPRCWPATRRRRPTPT